MRRSLAWYSAPVSFVHVPSRADFITITLGIRVFGTHRCFARNTGPYSSYAVDADLYPDLGYGEVTLSLVNTITRNYYLSVRVEKQPTGSKLTVRSGNTLATGTYINRIEA